MLTLLGGTLLASLAPERSPESLLRPLDGIGPEIEGWKLAREEGIPPAQLQATSYLARTYTKNDEPLGLLIAFHDSHRGAVSVHSPKNCLPGDGWEIWDSEIRNLVLDGRPVAINEYHIYKLDQRKAVLYWYQSRNRVVANEYLAKLFLLRDGMLDGRSSGSVVRIAMSDRPELLPDGLRFAGAVMRQLELCFRP
jgi:EpsI family protein